MNKLSIDFDWQRDPQGYRLKTRSLPRPHDVLVYHRADGVGRTRSARPSSQYAQVWHPFGIDLLEREDAADGQVHYVVRQGAPLQPYRPTERYETLFSIFACDAHSPEGVLTFIEKFGPLTQDGLDPKRGEFVEGVVAHANAMLEFLDETAHEKRRGTWATEFQTNPITSITARLIMNPETQAPMLRLSPRDLLDALWLQAAAAVIGGSNLERCHHCGIWFETGPGTVRRLNAKFCSDKHRIAFNSLKRSTPK